MSELSELAPYLPAVLFDWHRRFPERAGWEEEGALAFLDVSGFTAMSERLAKLGREGAEVVTDVIGDTFEQLLAVAYEAGGSLLKFGGDALLLWFGGEDAARRACQAAARTRAALRRLGPIRTPMGPVRLRMSAGVHAGTFQFFLVGDPAVHRELLVCSPAASRTCEMEAAASAGEILISPETASVIGPRWLGAAVGPGVLLNTPPPGGERQAPSLPDTTGIDVASFVPPMVRAAVTGAGRGEDAEHRQAAVGFVHFDGTDALISERGLDEAAAQLHELACVVQAACAEHGVAVLSSDVDRDGGKFLLCAGAPVTSAEDDERLLRALRAVADAGTTVPVRSGANRGLLFAGSIGPSYRRSYTLMGDIVNTAARVMSHAAPGEVLALKPVLDGAKSSFAAKRLPPFAAKGKTRPLVAYRVGHATGLRAQPRSTGAFVGREEELGVLLGLVEQARERHEGGLVELRGELGVGKTRLLDEACGRLGEDVRCVTVRGNPYESTTPYLPLRELLGDVLAGVDPGLADTDQQVFRAHVHAAVVAHLDAAVEGPWVLVVEEAQWLDEASAALVRHLGWHARTRPWAVFTARWSNEGPPVATGGVGTVLELAPLPRPEAERIVADRAPFPLLPQQVARVVERAAGNPLFLEQLVAAFDADDEESLPAGLEAVVASRIDRMPRGGRQSLRALSVLGPRFALEDAPVVLESALAEVDAAALDEFVEVDTATGVGRFRQAVFQSVAYAALSYRRRRELHEKFALHAESRGAEPSVLATHFELAQRDDKAWKYGLVAASYAQSHHAYASAADLYRRALRAAGRLGAGHVDQDDLRGAWQGFGDALRLMGRQADAAAPYQKARKLAGDDPAVQARLCLVEGDLRQRLGRPTIALRWFGRGLRLLAGSELGAETAKTRVRLLANSGRVRHDQGRFSEAISLLQTALREAEHWDDTPGIAHACLWLSYCEANTGRRNHRRLAQRALALYEALDAVPWQAAALNGLGVSARREGRLDDSRELLQQAADRLLQLGDPLSAAVARYNVADVLLDQGRNDEAVDVLRDVVRVFQAARHAYEPVAMASLARALAVSHPAESDALFSSAVERLEASGLASFACEAKVHWAEALAGRGLVDQAAELLEGRGASADPEVEARAARVQAVVAERRGDRDGAVEFAKEALKAARRAGDPRGVALAESLVSVVESSKTIWRESCTDQSS